jgi:Fe-S-cluster-containing hydrogenase component 2
LSFKIDCLTNSYQCLFGGRKSLKSEKEVAVSKDVYARLAEHLDDLPAGLPETESGVELRILRQLFTPEEAELATHINLIEEDATVIAHRAKIPVETAVRLLERMERKGLIYARRKPGELPRYQALGYIVGIYEFQVNKMTPELVRNFQEYESTWFDLDVWRNSPQLRTVPVNESIDVDLDVLPYEKAIQLIEAQERFAIAPCVCHQEQEILGNECDHIEERCLSFGHIADFYLHNGMGRESSRVEVFQILEQADQEGLVIQPANARDALFICVCCDCCSVIRNLKRHPQPASVVSSPFFAELEVKICEECGTCETRCQMEAILFDDISPRLDRERCIGCGLCVTTCPTGALQLVRKPVSERAPIPKSIPDANIQLGKVRGKLNNAHLVKMLVKSKVDRIVSAMK